MKNYKISDLNFFQQKFRTFQKTKNNIITAKDVPHNYRSVIEDGSMRYIYELGYKKAFAYLKTDSFEKKCNYIDINLFYDKKYATMYPKSCMLGEEPNKGFETKCKKIGDISFDEEDNKEIENVKNLHRLPPEYVTEEWLKVNLSTKVEMLRLDNCYWLSKDIISKLGRIDENLKEVYLANLELSNIIVTNILKWAQDLEILDISYCKGIGVGICENIFYCSKNLKSVNLSGQVHAVTDGGLASLSKIPSLEEINVSLCNQITDLALSELAKNKKQILTSINFTGLFKLTNNGISAVVLENTNSLKKIVISLLPQKTVDDSICYDISKCKVLSHLDISGCVNMSSSGLSSISDLKTIENVNISGIAAVEEQIASNFVMNNNKILKIFRMSNCPNITNSFLDFLTSFSNTLLLLELNRTPKISDTKINETIAKLSPNLRIIRATNFEADPMYCNLKIPRIKNSELDAQRSNQKGKNPNDEKAPANQLKRLIQETKPKRIGDIYKK